jgi:hypothetical protein
MIWPKRWGVTLADHDADDLASGYELLTGTPVPSNDE